MGDRKIDHDTAMCPHYLGAMELLGKRWTGLIIRVLMDGPQRFTELATRMDGCGDRMLSERLKELEALGILERRVTPEYPVRIDYALTEKGRSLEPVLAAIGEWGEKWIDTGPAPRRRKSSR